MWRKTQKIIANIVTPAMLLVYIVVVVSLINRWDAMVVVTLIPVWAWSAVGMLAALFCWLLCRKAHTLILFGLWLFTGIVLSEETTGLVREIRNPPLTNEKTVGTGQGTVLRIVSFDSAGRADVSGGMAELSPDILIIQNAPEERRMIDVADTLFGPDRVVAYHQGNAILASGELVATLADPESSTLHARIRLPGGLLLDITNLDLAFCSPNRNIWRQDEWKRLVAVRKKNRRQVRAALGENVITRSSTVRILGGGFGTPPGDDVYRPLQNSGLIDVYREVGSGWGDTYPAEYAALRLDQIWVSPNLKPLKAATRIVPYAAHRAVVCDVEMMPSQAR